MTFLGYTLTKRDSPCRWGRRLFMWTNIHRVNSVRCAEEHSLPVVPQLCVYQQTLTVGQLVFEVFVSLVLKSDSHRLIYEHWTRPLSCWCFINSDTKLKSDPAGNLEAWCDWSGKDFCPLKTDGSCSDSCQGCRNKPASFWTKFTRLVPSWGENLCLSGVWELNLLQFVTSTTFSVHYCLQRPVCTICSVETDVEWPPISSLAASWRAGKCLQWAEPVRTPQQLKSNPVLILTALAARTVLRSGGVWIVL